MFGKSHWLFSLVRKRGGHPTHLAHCCGCVVYISFAGVAIHNNLYNRLLSNVLVKQYSIVYACLLSTIVLLDYNDKSVHMDIVIMNIIIYIIL